ncbi:MAG: adenylate/guanylate cyclase domain-containing protein [Candidatus Limnocylindrales bacterium]
MPERVDDLEREYLERQSATNDLLRLIGSSAFDLETVFTSVVTTAARLCRAEHGRIYLLEGDLFRTVAFVGHANELISQIPAAPEGIDRGSAIGRAALTGAPVMIVDVLADPEYRLFDLQRTVGFRTLLAVPIQQEGRIIGAISAARNEVRAFSEAEILLVTAFADQAAIAIENARRMRTIERQRTELSRFLSPQVAELVSSDAGEELLKGHRRLITTVFCDLRGFTAFSETADPEELFGVLRAYHETMGELIVAHGGTLEHFAGDGMMVFFNDPMPQPDHAQRAVRMGVAMRDRVSELALGWHKRGYELAVGIGVASGYATLGRIGFEGRYDYGAIGNVVIMASRLSTEAKAGQILLSQRAHAAVEEIVDIEDIGELALKGFSRPVLAVNVVGIRSS